MNSQHIDLTYLQGSALEVLRGLPSQSVHSIVTSPPYYGLRDYGVEGQLGLEASPDVYIERLVGILREARRVLRDDGTCWLNLGDSYARDAKKGQHKPGDLGKQAYIYDIGGGRASACVNLENGLKAKDLLGIPWAVAFALRADGWYLRAEIVYAKRNCMPESVRDRPTRSHEQIFLLSKSPRYFYDSEAVKEEEVMKPQRRLTPRAANQDAKFHGQPAHRRPEGGVGGGRRNLRSVWWMSTHPYPEAHFATFPPSLPEVCVKASTSEYGCCPACGAGWTRIVEKPAPPEEIRNRGTGSKMDFHSRQVGADQRLQNFYDANPSRTTGWRQSCDCPAAPPTPCTILDPFSGAGTTGLVAASLGRAAILIDLNPEYHELARQRIAVWQETGRLR